MRRAAKIDANQPSVVKALRLIGCSVQPLHMVGGGCPDLLVGYRGRSIVLEVKDGNKVPSARLLTEQQEEWRAQFRGELYVVESPTEAIAAVTGGAV